MKKMIIQFIWYRYYKLTFGREKKKIYFDNYYDSNHKNLTDQRLKIEARNLNFMKFYFFWIIFDYIYISNPLISFPRKFRNFSYKILFSPLNSKSTRFTFFHLGSFVTILFHPTNLSLEFLRYTLKNFWNNRRSFISIFASQIFFSPEKFFSTSSPSSFFLLTTLSISFLDDSSIIHNEK